MIDLIIFGGSPSDAPYLEHMKNMAEKLGLRYRIHLTSAHRSPERTVNLIHEAEKDGAGVFICAAGMAAHLAGAVAAHTQKPVLGVPLPGGLLDGMDALLSTVQMPSGIPVATFAVGKAGAVNAVVFAAQILGLSQQNLSEAIGALRREAGETLVARDLDFVEKLSK